MSELPSDYHRNLPYGERMSAAELIGHPFFPFEGDVQVVPGGADVYRNCLRSSLRRSE